MRQLNSESGVSNVGVDSSKTGEVGIDKCILSYRSIHNLAACSRRNSVKL